MSHGVAVVQRGRRESEGAAFPREDGDHRSEGRENEKVRTDQPGEDREEEKRPRVGWGEVGRRAVARAERET